MKNPPSISSAEWTVMNVVLRNPGLTAQEVIDALVASTDWGPATIKTLLGRLLAKKALRFKKAGKAYRYFPTYSPDEFRAAEAESFVERVYDGALVPMLSHLVQSRRLSPSELTELRRILEEGAK
jgi:BlaI family penicillinase repressor